jgi:hypothetical protein
MSLPTFQRFSPALTSLPTGPVDVVPCLTGSYRSVQFLARGSLIALKMVTVRISETLVHTHQATWRCNPEDSHLPCSSYITAWPFHVRIWHPGFPWEIRRIKIVFLNREILPVEWLPARWTSGVRSPARANDIFPLISASRPDLDPIQPSV